MFFNLYIELMYDKIKKGEFMGKNSKGITLVSLVITIIVMLILAGVSLNMIMGDSSVLENANRAVVETEKARIAEELKTLLLGYNMDVSKTKPTVTEFLASKVGTVIDTCQAIPIEGNIKLVVSKGEYFFYVEKQGREYIVSPMETTLSEIGQGYTVVTSEELKKSENGSMKFELSGDETATLIFYDKINDSFNFEINGGNVTIYVTQDMTLTNNGMSRSAIKIASGATLNLEIAEGVTITVDSGFGENGVIANALGAKGGPGGYAGINVPSGATLNVVGSGKLIAYGGDAGDGGGAVSANTGGGGGGGAGAGIGGNGGDGGSAGSTFKFVSGIGELTNSGEDGAAGQDCGKVNFYGTTEVFAYGGAGGSGGSRNDSNNSGAGGGGYPAAGIGGGGAGGGGGEHACSAGGFSAGSGEESIKAGVNGLGSTGGGKRKGAGGGYYSKGSNKSGIQAYFNQGGMWCAPNEQYCIDYAGSGGIAGAGGNISYFDLSKIHAYNGDMVTEDSHSGVYYEYDIDGNQKSVITTRITKQNGVTIIPAIIYAQNGTAREVYKSNQHMSQSECNTYGATLYLKQNEPQNVKIIPRRDIEKTIYGQGIGSGAGYIESSNGTLKQL